MYSSPGRELNCQVARTLDVVGDKWSLLVIRNALRGQTRFSEFRDDLGAPTDVLTARLTKLVERGILERRTYRDAGSRERASYHLTERGEGLRLVVAALNQWGGEFDPGPRGPASLLVDASTHEPVQLAYVDADGALVPEVALIPGPGARTTW